MGSSTTLRGGCKLLAFLNFFPTFGTSGNNRMKEKLVNGYHFRMLSSYLFSPPCVFSRKSKFLFSLHKSPDGPIILSGLIPVHFLYIFRSDSTLHFFLCDTTSSDFFSLNFFLEESNHYPFDSPSRQ